MSTRFVLVRHGETLGSRDRRFTGSTDLALTDEGQKQAQALAQRLRPVRIDVIFTSPMRRCLETAAPITEVTGRKHTISEDLRECDFGQWEELSANDVRERYPDDFSRWISDEAFAPPDGESWVQVGERVERWFTEAADRYDGRTVLAVCHGGPILWLARHVSRAPLVAMIAFEVDPCSVTILQKRTQLWRLRTLNDTTHIADPLRDGPTPEGMPP